ncbi:hypothetical protein ABL78_7467 [Leptomonas seymouri]|uniref:Uncharacterized protein n=1 Tax=Leptomonas seymouri TaxID=5684 RepID=A0A0N1PBF0_LEPSE|nr:hypothetical protein ABL78_7467 [Leptomonas seymouri]|eukprot:KPI83493.1 hypothetical protein ABL78_7467 [Leptomonas seymouri]
MATREIGFGLYEVHRPTTSPTRRGAAKGRPQPRGLNPRTAPPGPKALTPPPTRPLATSSGPPPNTSPPGADCAVKQRVAAAQSRCPARAATRAAPRATTAPTASAPDSPSRCTGHVHNIAPAPQLSPVVPATVPPSSLSSPSSYLESHIRCVVNTTGSHVLLPSLLEILQGVLRLLQHDRALQKGQQPCRRRTSFNRGDLEGEVTCCLTQAAQATSLDSAATILEKFLVAHTTAAAMDTVAFSSPSSALPSTATATAAQTTCSPVVLLGATLAELYFSGRAPSCAVSPSSLFTYLDAAVAAGHPGAMVCVGLCLRDGRGGMQQDVKAGLAWMQCAASIGYLPAMHELGETYEVGVQGPQSSSPPALLEAEGADVDWGEAMRWYQQAAEAGYAPSQLNLGKLLLLAAEQGLQDDSADTAALDHLNAAAKRWLQACAAAGVEEGVRLLKWVGQSGGRC